MKKVVFIFIVFLFSILHCKKNGNSNIKDQYESHFVKPDFIFAVYGETAGSNSVHKKIISHMSKQKIDIIFHTGNLVNNPKKEKDWENFFMTLTPISGIIRHYYVVPGEKEKDFIDILKLRFANLSALMKNGTFYSIIFKNSLFIILNGYESLQNFYRQQNYIIEILRNFIIKINGPVFVFINKPIYSTGPSGVDQFLTRNLLILLEHFRVSIIFSGKDKIYGRYKSASSIYTSCIVTGGGGKKLDLCGDVNSEFEQFVCLEKQHYVLVAVKGGRVGVKSISTDNVVIDSFETNLPSRKHTRKGIVNVYTPF